MVPDHPITTLLGGLADPGTRAESATAIARALGCEQLMLLSRDPEIDVYLPAPGLPQTLPGAGAWQSFVARCAADGEATGMLPLADGALLGARGLAAGGVLAVLLGNGAASEDLNPLVPVLPILDALFRSERTADAATARVSIALESVQRATALTQTLQTIRAELQDAILEAERARESARREAEQSESFAQELEIQTAQLQEQAAELEMLNEELSQRTAEAEAAREAADSANEAKSDFLATMSHELRTPVNAIIGYTDLLVLGISGDVSPDQKVHLERIRASSRHLLTLINDVLDLAKIESGHMSLTRTPGNTRAPVIDAIGLLALQAQERGIELTNEGAGDGLPYVGDEDRVRQVIINLLSNAVKFTPNSGRVTVSCAAVDGRTDSAYLSEGRWTRVTVRDSGIGVAQEELEAIFRPFVQAEMGHSRTRGGTGLGLTISRQLARLMGGDLTAVSEQGRGSAFTLWLPRETTASLPLDETIRVLPPRAANGPKEIQLR